MKPAAHDDYPDRRPIQGKQAISTRQAEIRGDITWFGVALEMFFRAQANLPSTFFNESRL
jgi:hypothetical protein